MTGHVKPAHKEGFKQMLAEVHSIEKKNCERFKEALRTQVIPKLTVTYRQREDEWAVISQTEGIVELLEQAKTDQYREPEAY